MLKRVRVLRTSFAFCDYRNGAPQQVEIVHEAASLYIQAIKSKFGAGWNGVWTICLPFAGNTRHYRKSFGETFRNSDAVF